MTTLSRNVLQRGRNLIRTVRLNGFASKRGVPIVSEDTKYDVPELATAKPFEDIPGPKVFPIIGSSWIYFPIIGKYNINKLHIADKHKNQIYGNIVRENFGKNNVVLCFTPSAMQTMAQHEGKYPSRSGLSALKAYRELRKELYTTGSVVLLNGREWYDSRRKVQKYIMKPKTVQSYLGPLQDVTDDLIKTIYRKMDEKMEVHGFFEDLYRWALESIAYVALDTRLNCLDPNFPPDSDGMKLIQSIQDQFDSLNKLENFTGNFQFWKYLPSKAWRRFVKAADISTEIAFKYINSSVDNLKKRIDEDKEVTILQSMLLSKEFDASQAMVMAADLIFGGVDLVSHTVAFLMYELSKNPEKQKILAEELQQLLPNKEDRITPEIFNHLHYLKACLKESLRLNPGVRGIRRTLEHDVVIEGYRIPAGTFIIAILQQVCRKEKYFKNPNQFLPERWMNKDEKLSTPFAYLPFGIGVRSCMGRRLSELEIFCITAKIFRNFEVQYNYEDLDMLTRFVNIPDKEIVFSFLER